MNARCTIICPISHRVYHFERMESIDYFPMLTPTNTLMYTVYIETQTEVVVRVCTHAGYGALKCDKLRGDVGEQVGLLEALSALHGRPSPVCLRPAPFTPSSSPFPPPPRPLTDISHMRVSIWPIRRAGSLGYLAGSWKEATSILLIFFL